MNIPEDKEFAGKLAYQPLCKDNWQKFVNLFGEKGAADNCWCMYYRLTKTEYNEGKMGGNKEAMKNLVMNDEPTGIMAFYEGKAIAWCAFAPREHFKKLDNSRVHKRVDDQLVWSVPCFFADKRFRHLGVTAELLKAAIRYAKEKGIKIIEAYPIMPSAQKRPASSLWNGKYKSFEEVGFEIVNPTSGDRPVVRYYVDKQE